jgi:hypothetical protein
MLLRSIKNFLFIPSSAMSGQQVADFTTTGGENQAICQCKLSFPPGTKLFYMQVQNPTKQGKYLCASCHMYHVEKSESIPCT